MIIVFRFLKSQKLSNIKIGLLTIAITLNAFYSFLYLLLIVLGIVKNYDFFDVFLWANFIVAIAAVIVKRKLRKKLIAES